MVVEDMRNTGVLGRPEEYFLSWEQKDHSDWRSELKALIDIARSSNGESAVKVMANQLSPINRRLETFVNVDDDPKPFSAFRSVFPKANWVKITRIDVVAQAISRMISKETGIYHAISDKNDSHFVGSLLKGEHKDYNAKAVFKFDELLDEIVSITLENLTWSHFFEAHNIEPLELFYEKYQGDDQMAYLDRIAEVSKIDIPVPKKSRKLVKLSNKLNDEWRDRFLKEAASKKFRINTAS